MSSRMKKKSGAMKYLLLVIVLVILVTIFYITNNEDNEQNNNQNSNASSNSASTNIPNNNNQPNGNNPSGNTSNNEQTNPPHTNENTDGTISGSGDIVDVDNYVLFDTYVIASENTKYGNEGYKYFIVRSYSDYEKYITQNLQSPFDSSYVSNYDSINKETITNLQNKITKDFFKHNCLIFIVDYSTKDVGAQITNIQIAENNLTLNIDRNFNTTDKSKYTTYIVPLEVTSIKSVSISYIR